MLEKYTSQFEEMYREIKNGKDVLEIVNKNMHFFEKEGIGPLAITNYLCNYIQEKEF